MEQVARLRLFQAGLARYKFMTTPDTPQSGPIPAQPAKADAFSALIVSFHTGPALTSCLNALLASSQTGEIILVDNGNPAEIRADLRAWAAREPRLHYHPQSENLGFGRATNLAASHSRGDNWLIINPDAVVEPDTLRRLLDASKRLASPFILGGILVDARGHEQRAARRRRPTLKRLVMTMSGLERLQQRLPFLQGVNLPLPRHNDAATINGLTDGLVIPMEVISGALFATNRTTFQRFGGFDPRFFLHVEDIDLCVRVNEGGGQTWLCPTARAMHVRGSSRASKLWVERQKVAGFRRFFHDRLNSRLLMLLADFVLLAMFVGLIIRMLFDSWNDQPSPKP